MRSIYRTGIVALVVAVAVAGVSSTAFAKGQKKNKGTHATGGKVTAVDQNSLTIETKKKGAKQFTLTSTTVYEKASKDSTKPATPATLADVKTGRHVKVVAAGGQAQKVTLRGGKGKGGKAKGQGKGGKKHK
jgi:hypothetical protein